MTPYVHMLPETYSVGPNDVIIGRGKKCTLNPGNQRFKALIATTLESYSNAETKVKKSEIIMDLLTEVRADDGAGFVKQDTASGRFIQVEEASCRIAIAQAFRDALSGAYKSSKKHKQQRRLERKQAGAIATCVAAGQPYYGAEQDEPIPVSRTIFEEAFHPAPVVEQPKSYPFPVAPSSLSMFQLRGMLQDATATMEEDFHPTPVASSHMIRSRAAAAALRVPLPHQRQQHKDLFSSLYNMFDTSLTSVAAADPFEPTPLTGQTPTLPVNNHVTPKAA